MFTRCYEHTTNNQKVVLLSNDPFKEIASLGWLPDPEDFGNVYNTIAEFPELTNEGYANGRDVDGHQWYITDRLEFSRSLKSRLTHEAWETYKLLRNYSDGDGKDIMPANIHDFNDLWQKRAERMLPEALAEFISACFNQTGNYSTSFSFEISPRNVSSSHGKRVLADCFFDVSLAMQIRNS